MAWDILVAAASFKGSLSAVDAGEAIRRGLAHVLPGSRVSVVPLGDGGEGTMDALLLARGGRRYTTQVTGPLGLDTVPADWAVLGDGLTAVIETAQASGLPLVPQERRDPMVTTTAGVGELIREALGRGCRKLLIGLGGSATVDGGLGALRALGAALLDAQGRPVLPGGRGLAGLRSVGLDGLDPRLLGCEVVALADVDNPLLGPEGAAPVFGPQKGADQATVEALERGLANLAEVAAKELGLGFDLATLPGGGSAGGLGAALAAFLEARIVSGIDFVMEAADLRNKVSLVDLVITGEGRLDGQSRRGKTCSGVARLARLAGRPVVVLAGGVAGEEEAIEAMGLDAVLPLPPGPMTLIEAMEGAAGQLEMAAARLARLLLTGAKLPPPRRRGRKTG